MGCIRQPRKKMHYLREPLSMQQQTKKKKIIVLLHGLDIEADPSTHSFVPWIPIEHSFVPWVPIEPCLLFSLSHFFNPFELLWLPPSLSVCHCCPPALAQQFSLLVFIFFYPGHSLYPCPPRGLGISTPMHRSQALGCSEQFWAGLKGQRSQGAAGTAGCHTKDR